MKKYSIKELELLTGIKSHTLRIWENRYDIIEPKRTETNIRYYLDEDLKKLLNVAHLNKAGIKISKIAEMSESERHQKVLETSEDAKDSETQIQILTNAMMELDELKFNHVLSTVTLQIGFEKCITQIIYPFLERIGRLWQTSSICVAQEHFVSNLIRQKIITAIDGQILKDPEHSTRILLFCPPEEKHELALLFANYILRKHGFHTLYLGADLPMGDLKLIKNDYEPSVFIISTTAGYSRTKQDEFLNLLKEGLNKTPGIVIGGVGHEWKKKWPENLTICKDIAQIQSLVAEHSNSV